MSRCCYCDAPVSAAYDYCSDCDRQYSAAFGPAWQQLAWHQETVQISRRERYAERRETLISTLSPDVLASAAPVLPRDEPISAAALDDLIAAAQSTAPNAGWRRMHQIIVAQGIATTASHVQSRLRVLRSRC